MGREPPGRSEDETVDLAGIRDAPLRRERNEIYEYLTSGGLGPCDSSANVGAGAQAHEAWAAWWRSRLTQLEESCDESPWLDMLTGRAAPVVDDLVAGSVVSGFWHGEWYPGVVAALLPNGLIEVVWSDEDTDTKSNLFRTGVRMRLVDDLVAGSVVSGFWHGEWYPGVVAALLTNGLIEVVWSDEDTKSHLFRTGVRMRPPPPARQGPSPSAETWPSSGADVATAASTLPFNLLQSRRLLGCHVELSGLVSEKGLLLNGQRGIVKKYSEDIQRCEVSLDSGEVVSVKAAAVMLVRAPGPPSRWLYGRSF